MKCPGSFTGPEGMRKAGREGDRCGPRGRQPVAETPRTSRAPIPSRGRGAPAAASEKGRVASEEACRPTDDGLESPGASRERRPLHRPLGVDREEAEAASEPLCGSGAFYSGPCGFARPPNCHRGPVCRSESIPRHHRECSDISTSILRCVVYSLLTPSPPAAGLRQAGGRRAVLRLVHYPRLLEGRADTPSWHPGQGGRGPETPVDAWGLAGDREGRGTCRRSACARSNADGIQQAGVHDLVRLLQV